MNQAEKPLTPTHQKPRRFQFGLKTLLLMPIVTAVVCMGYIWGEVAGAVVAVLVSALVLSYLPQFQVRKSSRGGRETVRLFCFIMILLTLFHVLFQPITSRAVNYEARCKFKMEQIAIALRNYHADFECFPPSYIPDETGKPMHSWRVLLLPYLDRTDLYNEYNFSEPWDGPNNSQLSMVHVDAYVCWPDCSQGPIRTTSYLAVVGDRTLWPGSRSMTLPTNGNKPGDKILVVEVANSGISWLDPRDLSIDEMSFEINDSSRIGIRSHHPGGAHVAFADGTARFLKCRDQGDLKKLLRP